MLSFFPRDVLDEIWDLIESVSEGFPIYSSILLEELIAIQMVLLFVINHKKNTDDSTTTNLLILSSSQSPVGILTLGWEATRQKVTVHEVRRRWHKCRKWE